MKSGCVQKSFFGCSFIFLFLAVIIVMMWISSQLPEINFSTNDQSKREYQIEVDTTINEKVIKSLFTWQFVDNSLRKEVTNYLSSFGKGCNRSDEVC